MKETSERILPENNKISMGNKLPILQNSERQYYDKPTNSYFKH